MIPQKLITVAIGVMLLIISIGYLVMNGNIGCMRLPKCAARKTQQGEKAHFSPNDNSQGYVLGYDIRGIAVIDLDQKEKRYLLRNDESHFWVSPAWDTQQRRLICVNAKTGNVVWRRIGSEQHHILYSPASGSEVTQIAIVDDGVLLLVLPPASRFQKELVLIDGASKQSRTVTRGNFDPWQPLVPVGDNRALLLRMARTRTDWGRYIAEGNSSLLCNNGGRK